MGGFHRHFGRDPAAERDADDGYALEVEVLQEVEIEIGKIIDRRERAWLFGITETRMAWRDQACACVESIEDGSLRIDANARVKKERGRPRPRSMISRWILLTLRCVASVGTDVLELFPGDFIYGHCYRM